MRNLQHGSEVSPDLSSEVVKPDFEHPLMENLQLH